MKPLINILIRTSNRSNLFKRCFDSITSQGYPNIRIIVSYDNDRVNYIPESVEKLRVYAISNEDHFYALYCNELKALVTDGWFMFLDDDDYLLPGALNKIVLDHPAILHQHNHIGNIVPKRAKLFYGQVATPCLMLHHSLKNLADLKHVECNDYYWIKEVSELTDVKFVPMVISESDRRGLGK